MFGNNMQQGMPFNNNMNNNPNMPFNANSNNMANIFLSPNMMNNAQMGFNSPNIMNNNNLMFNNNISNNNNITDFSKMKVTFKYLDDKIFTFPVDCDMPIDELLKQFCKETGHPEYIGTYDKIKFIYKAGILKFDDKTPVLMKLMSREPKIIVHDVSNIIG